MAKVKSKQKVDAKILVTFCSIFFFILAILLVKGTMAIPIEGCVEIDCLLMPAGIALGYWGAIVLFVSGFGLLKFRTWARILAIIISCITIIVTWLFYTDMNAWVSIVLVFCSLIVLYLCLINKNLNSKFIYKNKNKFDTVMLAILFGVWVWLYTYKHDAWKFWVGLSATIAGWVFFFPWIVVWVAAIVDSLRKDEKTFRNY